MAEKKGVRASIVLVVVGLAFWGLGMMVSLGEEVSNVYLGQAGSGSVSYYGLGIAGVGGFLFALGLLVEFFAMGSALRSIAQSLDRPSQSASVPPTLQS